MGKLHSQLALFGSIDDEVVSRNDPRTTAIVESFLPGTTGYGQRGWFGELRNFVNQLAPSGSVEFPNREEALRDLVRPAPVTVAPDDQSHGVGVRANLIGARHQAIVTEMSREDFQQLVDRAEPPPIPTAPAGPESLTWSTLARATYAAAVIAKVDGPLRGQQAPSPPDPICLRWGNRGILRIRDDVHAAEPDPLTTLLEMAVPHRYTRGLNIDTLPSRPPLRAVISDDRALDRGRADWQPFMARMGLARGVDPRVAGYPPPCVGAVRKIGGEFCTVVSTEVFANVQLDQLEAIVDPRNWHQDLPSFFCTMEPRPDDPSGWRQILECVSTECSEYRLKTALKYWNADRNDDGIYINYDLAADRTGDSGLVEVDSGYIWIVKAKPTGVRIKTSKALRICGLSPTATAALACYSGWAQVGIDMLVNAALRPHQGATDFNPSSLPESASAVVQATPLSMDATDTDPAATRLPTLPPGFRRDLLEDSAEQVNRYIDATSLLAKNFARRWQNGLTRTDLQRFGELAGKEMTDLAVGSFDSVMGNFRPQANRRRAGDAGEGAPSPHPDVVDRLAEAARQVVDESTSVAVTAADKIDRGSYDASEMTDTATRLAGIAMKGWATIAGIPFGSPAESAHLDESVVAPAVPAMPATAPLRVSGSGLGMVLQAFGELANRTFLMNLDVAEDLVHKRVPEATTVVTDHMTAVLRRMANQARTVTDDAAKRLDAEGFGADDVVKTLTTLCDVALINGIEMAGTALVGPGRYERGPITSDVFTLANADPHRRHKLELATPLALAGSDDGDSISEDRVTFDPTDGVLPAGNSGFRIRVKPIGLRSGVYLGTVWAVPLDASGSQDSREPTSEQMVPVIIGV